MPCTTRRGPRGHWAASSWVPAGAGLSCSMLLRKRTGGSRNGCAICSGFHLPLNGRAARSSSTSRTVQLCRRENARRRQQHGSHMPFRNRRVLVTGGTGLIGRPLVQLLLEEGANVRVASLDDASRVPPGVEFLRADLTRFEACREACEGIEYVFHLAGIKGSPAMASRKPASFFVPTLLFNTNMMEAARQAGVEGYLYTSTIGVYAPAEVLREDDVLRT